ncbi:MAG: hypothetical protein KC609_15205 [Myxococcales bacterium]|nr:hypothetical protein [Myxococcales bacterium]
MVRATMVLVLALLGIASMSACSKKAKTAEPTKKTMPKERRERIAMRRKVVGLIDKGKIDEAERELRAFLKRRPDVPGAWNALGHVRELRHDDRGAKGAYQRAHLLRPKRSIFSIRLARVCYRIDDHRCALGTIEEMMPNDHVSATQMLALVTSPALEFLEPAPSPTPSKADRLTEMALGAMKRLKYKEAHRLFVQAFEADKTGLVTLHNAAVYYGKQGNYGAAMVYARRAIDLVVKGTTKPRDKREKAAIYLMRAIVLHRFGKHKQAKVAYLNVLEIDPSSSDALFGLAVMMWRLAEPSGIPTLKARLKKQAPKLAARLELVLAFRGSLKPFEHQH